MSKKSEVYINASEIAEKLNSGGYQLMKKSGNSRLWKVFSAILNENGDELNDFLYCKRCDKVLKCQPLSNTSALKHAEGHLRGDAEKVTAKTLVELLTKWLIRECIPYDMLNGEHFKNVLEGFINIGTKFSANTSIDKLMPIYPDYTRNLFEAYDQCFDMVKTEIQDLENGNDFGVTADIWTDDFTKETYIAMMIHYMKNSSLTFRLLGFSALQEEEEDTHKSVAIKIRKILEDFDCKLTGKSILVTRGDEEIINAFPNTRTIVCMSHLLQNAIKNSMAEIPEIKEIINTCLKLASVLTKPSLITIVGSSLPTSSPNECQHMYRIMNAVEGNWTKIQEALRNQNETAVVKEINIQHLRSLVNILEHFLEAIVALEDENNATLHLVVVYLHDLKKTCSTGDTERADFNCIKKLKKSLQLKLKKIMSENITTLHKIALFLYPPANKLIQFSETERQCVEKECVRLVKYFESDLKVLMPESEPSTTRVSKRLKIFTDFVETKATNDFNKLINEEIRLYKNTNIPHTVDFDLLSWWKLQETNFALLYKLSCTVLAIPASSAVTKRLFSTANSLLCQKYANNVKDMEIEKIMFLNFNNGREDEI